MFHFRRWALLLVCLLFSMLSAPPLVAQEAQPLAVGTIVRDQLSAGGSTVTYAFVVPAGQDAVVALDADHVVLLSYCVQVADGASDCSDWGAGGDGDPNVERTLLIPGLDDAAQTIDLTLTRPFDGTARYSLVAYLQDVRSAPLGDILTYQLTGEQPYLVYSLTADPAQPLTVAIEDSDERGNFLWVAYQPYVPGGVKIVDERLPIPQLVDGAARGTTAIGIQGVSLLYLGGSSFRVLVTSSGSFSLHAASPAIQPLAAGASLPVTVSYREPLRALRLDADADTAALIYANVTAGTGALVMVYSQDHPYGDGLALGAGGRAGVPFPLQGQIDAGRAGTDPLLVVQVPFEFTRSQVTVALRWQPQ